MKNCIHCGKEMDEGVQICPVCGKPAVMEEWQKLAQKKEEKKKPVKMIATIAAVVILAVLILVGGKNGEQLNENEMIAYENCLALKEDLKDPDSFKLYSDIVMVKWWDSLMGDECNYVFIEYGGTNSYGAMMKSTAIFDGTAYIMSDDIRKAANVKQIMAAAVLGQHRTGWKSEKQLKEMDLEYTYEYIDIDTDKIKAKLGLE